MVSRNPEDGPESLLPVYVVMHISGGLVTAQWGPKRGHCSAHGSGQTYKRGFSDKVFKHPCV